MRGPSIADDLSLALRIVDEATAYALEAFDRGVAIERKGDGTEVTEADRAVEQLIVMALSEHRPSDAVLGEEFGGRSAGGRRWIIDPIDGTKNFIAGRSDWGVHLALEDDGEVVVGVVSRPALGRRWWAGRGLGAFASGPGEATERLQVSRTRELAGARVEAWGASAEVRARVSAACGWIEYTDLDAPLRVLDGRLDAFVDHTASKVWDRAPLVVILEEAGGRYRDRTGGADLRLPGGVFTNGSIDDALLPLVGSP